MMKLVRSVRSSGAWAPLTAVVVFATGVLAKSPVLTMAGFFSMAAAALYVGFFAPDAKRAKAMQARIRARSSDAA
ncbi:hypothetical protein [Xanthomonas euvesicatoria]|uniref:hypothetical protein n=1 Tax=Xanthomonas euvesicatoria TaxID=456327 RepID=UPI001C492D57|nr:hypothetical protein [Xanthomonas euvesicatoria]MBV6831316.1 hypothetical protein [Xanthomonas campestris pv. viegasii]